MKNFLIYRSSAGSGKTYTLVKEYLKLVLKEPENFKSVLAVTFTNKSAAEMKNRIVEALIALAEGKDEKLKHELIKEGIAINIELAASQVLQNILHRYSYFSVSTIDSFFHKILRSFARELKLQIGYNIELEQKEILDKITDKLLDDAGNDRELTEYIENYIYYSIDDETGWNIDKKIKDIAQEIFNERFWIKSGTENELLNNRQKLKEFINKLFAIKNDFVETMLKINNETLKILQHSGLTADDFPHKKQGYINYLLKNIINDKYEPGKRVRIAIENINNMFIKSSKPQVKKAAEGGLYTLLCNAVENYDKNIEKYNSASELIKTIYVTGIFKDLIDKLKTYRDENKTLLISDVNNLLVSVISDESSPFVYEKTGSYFKNFLIDEFQDTSTFQWRNFKPLIENALSENNASIIVGDIKQSVYRWRNGNMKLLLEDVKNDLEAFRSDIEEKVLTKNYRSSHEIINFNNSFFNSAAKEAAKWVSEDKGEVIEQVYSDTFQKPGKDIKEGYIKIKYFDKADDYENTPRDQSLKETINEIQNLLKIGYSQKDFLILVRNKIDAKEAAKALLNEKNLKIVSSDSLLLTNSPKVSLLINLFKFIADKTNLLAYTEILFNYLIYIKDEKTDLNEIFTDHLKKKSSLFSKVLPAGFFENESSVINAKLLKLPLYELAEEMISIFELNNGSDAYLLRFLDLLKEYSEKFNSGIYGFVKWWDENKSKSSIVISEDEDAVRIMTIHKAKGLQSPVVFMPFTNWQIELKSGRDMFWASAKEPPFDSSPSFFLNANKALENSYFSEDYNVEKTLTLLDNLNLLYVAFTRAEERLYVNIPESSHSIKRCGDLIKDTLLKNPELSQKFNQESKSYIAGNHNFKHLDNKPNTENDNIINDEDKLKAYAVEQFYSGNLLEDILLKPEREFNSYEKINEIEKFRNRGIILHRGLSCIKTSDDLEIRNASRRLAIEGLITFDIVIETETELKEILSNELVKEWFKPNLKIMNEHEIILPDGRIYRPDRVIFNKDKVIIVDYKTGNKKPEHKKQLKEYTEIIKQMGFKETESYIFYLTERKVENV